MGIFDRLERSANQASVTYGPQWTQTDHRWFRPIDAWADTFAGFPIGPDSAMRISAVFACVSLLAEVLASLPCVLYRRLDNGGKERARTHRWYRPIRQAPNVTRRLSAMDYFGTQQLHLGLRGNAIAKIMDDDRRPELTPLHPDYVKVEKLTSGRVQYVHHDPERVREPETLRQEQVLHVRDLSMSGWTGMARAFLAREAIAVAAAGEAFVGGFFKNDATGRLVVKTATALDETRRKEVQRVIQENYGGWAKRSKVMVPPFGVEIDELGTLEEAAFLMDPRRFQVADIARFWRCPLFMIGLEEKSTTWGSGLEQQWQGFVAVTLKAWADRHTQAMALALLDEDEQEEFFFEFLFADLVRGDLLQRMQAYEIGRRVGMYSPNDLLRKENETPREDPGGNEYNSLLPGTANPADPTRPGRPLPPPEDDEDDEDEEDEPQRRRRRREERNDDEAARRIPGPLVVDAAARLAGVEVRAIGRRAAKATEDSTRWTEWLTAFYADHGQLVGEVLQPLTASFECDERVIALAGERIRATATAALAAGVPDGWLDARPHEVRMILEETFSVGTALRRAATTGV